MRRRHNNNHNQNSNAVHNAVTRTMWTTWKPRKPSFETPCSARSGMIPTPRGVAILVAIPALPATVATLATPPPQART